MSAFENPMQLRQIAFSPSLLGIATGEKTIRKPACKRSLLRPLSDVDTTGIVKALFE